jgi:hypothetical protein
MLHAARMWRGKWLLVVGGAALSGSFASHAAAEAAPNRWRSGGYYALNGGAMVALAGGALAAEVSFPDVCAGPDSCWFPGDLSVRQNHSLAARRWSQATVWLTVVSPVAASVGRGVDDRFANTELIYGETLSLNIFLHSLVKFAVRRPRPFTYQLPPRAHCATKDCDVSFYSGHASTAFAAAVAGSYLFAESAPDRGSRYAMWGFELALASATANLRVRGGMHYYSDVLVGALVGSGVGVLIPVLHGERYRPDAWELASAGGGLVTGALISQWLPTGSAASEAASWSITPLTFRAGSGLALHGVF